ncbi:hypothetical protein, partial [Bacteroides heparinolyticus]|uniref:hypothetical protein n=1 Tax=Prevotella heparinolytica TaxID=28113 RepID=UPI0035A1D04C
SDGSNTCVCHVRDLCLPAWTLASVATKDCGCQNRRREGGLKGSLLPDRRKPVHPGNIRPTGRSPSSSAKGTAYPEF